MTLHNLKAVLQVLGNPAADVPQPFGCQTSVFSKSSIHRNRVTSEVFHDHVEHRVSPSNGCSTLTTFELIAGCILIFIIVL